MKKTQAMVASKRRFDQPSPPMLTLLERVVNLFGIERQILSLRDKHKYGKSLYWAGQLFSSEFFDRSPATVVEAEDSDDDA